ncbi:hypothetical protein [Paenibacillus sp. S150]|uniref:hypothetical protein n=1 Tax=Paenibacillus sp. S150 TaxID=2749826 RepID=UPI001C5A3183|nr:hypothetical protein [Paenibacillus sp. S150]MBW4080149.1 hypothetical protein [Paenibacillus sp. S150]
MLNLLDLRRFGRNKPMIVLLLVYCLFQVFGIFMQSQYPPAEVNGVSVPALSEGEFMQHTLSIAPSWVLIYLTVFVVAFYMSEYNAGFYKNYISMRRARIYSVLSKIAVQALFTLLLLIAVVLSDVVGRFWFFGNSSFGGVGLFTKVLAVQFLLHWAFSVLVLCLIVIVRNMLTGVIAGIVLSFNIVGMALSALETAIGSPRISPYLLVNTIVTPQDMGNGGDILHAVPVAAVFALLFAAIAVRRKLREDLR